jgi:hypothetical protein
MRRLIPHAIVIASAGALTAGVATSTAAATATKVTCNTTEYNPTPTNASGVVLGFTSCSKPFGSGVVSASYTSTFNSATGAGTDSGPFTKWLLTGTVHGRFTGNYRFTSDTDATWANAITISGGTGAFKGVTSKGPEICSTTNGGASLTCTEVLELTGL